MQQQKKKNSQKADDHKQFLIMTEDPLNMHQITKPARKMAENDSQKPNDSFESEDRYIIYSVAIPTHIKHRTQSMIPLSKPIIKLAETDRNNDVTQIANLKLTGAKGTKNNFWIP